MRKVALTLLVLLGLLLGAGLWIYHDVLGPGPGREPLLAESARVEEPQQPVAPAPLPRREGPGPAPRAESPPDVADRDRIAVTVTETKANELLRTRPEIREALEQANVSNLRIRFEPDRLVAEGRVPVWADLKARVHATGRVWVEQGRLAYEIVSLRVGRFPAPRAAREELDRQIAAAISDLEDRFRGQVETIDIRKGEIRIEGTLR